jgi:hypothetical protein
MARPPDQLSKRSFDDVVVLRQTLGSPIATQPGGGDVPRWIQGCCRGADGDGLAGADFPGDHPDGVLIHAPGDPGDRFGVSGVSVQHRWGKSPAERHAGETVIRLQAFDAHADAPFWHVASSMSSMLS